VVIGTAILLTVMVGQNQFSSETLCTIVRVFVPLQNHDMFFTQYSDVCRTISMVTE